MVFGNTGMDDKDLFIRAANGEDVISSIYPNLTMQNLVSPGLTNLNCSLDMKRFYQNSQGNWVNKADGSVWKLTKNLDLEPALMNLSGAFTKNDGKGNSESNDGKGNWVKKSADGSEWSHAADGRSFKRDAKGNTVATGADGSQKITKAVRLLLI